MKETICPSCGLTHVPGFDCDAFCASVEKSIKSVSTKQKSIWEQFHNAGFQDIWYASGHPVSKYGDIKTGQRFHAGIWTGPQHDLISVKRCESNEEANWWLSPHGWDPEEATDWALELLEMGPVEFDKKYPNQRSPVNLDNYVVEKEA